MTGPHPTGPHGPDQPRLPRPPGLRPLPPPPRTGVEAMNAYLAEHLPTLQGEVRAEARRLPRPELPDRGELRRTRDPLDEALARSEDPSFHALATAVRRGLADERDLRRHPEFGRLMAEIAAERAQAARDALERRRR
ncbi:hypothetical protein ACOACO_00775 [Nocardioides sp. CPCC 205120]|uniref:hypothetical protein n=1 Tax=Nocardioides sp. CPCC 205120 TaxID=3406462 RepID=UPI003B50B3C7